MPRQIAALKDHLASGDSAGVERQAHTIKGAAANVGGEALRAAAAAVERTARDRDAPAAEARTLELVKQFGRLKQALTREL
jgi:HPt (histidine-containing phosphotransfer) domain-containing protein